MTDPTAQTPPTRAMGFWMTLALVMGSMIGSGVFLLPASLAPLGWNSVFGWLLTIAGALSMAAVFAALAKAYPQAGGPYAYTRLAFGAGPAFAVGWAYWMSIVVGNAAIATAAVSYLSRLFPAIGVPGLSAVTSVSLIWVFTLINIGGAGLSGRVQLITLVLKLVPLIAVIGLAAYILTRDGVAVVTPFDSAAISLGGITSAATLTLWAMLGIETATVPADNVCNPEKTIPRATMLGAAAAGLIYLFVCSAIVLMIPAEITANSAAPFADFVAFYVGSDAGLVLAGFGAISALGALNGWVMVQAEMPLALARDGLFPTAFGRLSARGTPVVSHLVSSGLLSGVVLLNYTKSMADLFEFLILMTTAIVLFVYFICGLAAGSLLVRRQLPRTKWLIFSVIAGLTFSIWTMVGAGAEAVGYGLLLLLAGVPIYLLGKLRRE